MFTFFTIIILFFLVVFSSKIPDHSYIKARNNNNTPNNTRAKAPFFHKRLFFEVQFHQWILMI